MPEYSQSDILEMLRSVQSGNTHVRWPSLSQIHVPERPTDELVWNIADLWNALILRNMVTSVEEAARDIISLSSISSSAYPLSINDGLLADRLKGASVDHVRQFALSVMESAQAVPVLRSALKSFLAELS